MEDIKREIYEMDAIEAKQAELLNKQMEERGYSKCKICEHWIDEEDLTYGVCESCIDEIVADTTLDEVIEYANTLDEDSELTFYTEYLFTKGQVIEILKEYARKTEPKTMFNKAIQEYITCDTIDYITYLDDKGELI